MTVRRRLRSWFCVLWNGRHEYYTQRDKTRVYQHCILCGHDTRGWDLSTKDRHAVRQ